MHPAVDAFAGQLASELVMAEVLISRHPSGFELRHVADRSLSAEKLLALPVANLRELAQFTDPGDFRPLKSAPNLRKGWRALPSNKAELGVALNHLYPGALADWYACRDASQVPVTNYRAFTNRQTGMYLITQKLSDVQAAQAIRACCDVRFCLKRRLWSVEGLGVDDPSSKSIILCLEPCALLLEFVRTVARLDQSGQAQPQVRDEDAPTADPCIPYRVPEADFNDPQNPRRRQFNLERSERSVLSETVKR